ncbi:MAG: rod shape-determining protein [Clostridia bacterium]|nr:rod shape-determining protein [Clostridia bacterium]
MRSDIGIDFGTDTTRIFMGRSIVLSRPTVITIDNATGEPKAYGNEAYQMIGRTSDRLTSVCPVQNGTIADFEAAELLLKKYFAEVSGKKLLRPRTMVAIPGNITAVKQRSVVDALESAGARNVCLIEAPLAAAIGLDVDFSTPRGVTVVDIGKGTTDIAVLSMGGLARCESLPIGSGSFDEEIIRFIRREYNVNVGALTAERIKKTIGCVKPRELEVGMTVSGLNVFTGMPQSIEVDTTRLYDIMMITAEEILGSIQRVFEQTAPEMVADTAKDGIILTGGGSLTYGMPELLSQRLGLQAKRVEDPLNCVIKGIGKALNNSQVLKNGDYRFRSLEDLTIE